MSKVAQRSLPSQNQAERDGERENDRWTEETDRMTVAHVTWRQWLDSLILVDIHQGRLPPRQGPPHPRFGSRMRLTGNSGSDGVAR